MAFPSAAPKEAGVVTPLSPSVLRQTATLIQVVEQEGDGYKITPAADPAPTFKCALLPPKTFSAPTSDVAPRMWRNKSELFYLAKVLGTPQTEYAAGVRVEIDGVEYETVGDSLAKRLGIATFAYVQRVLHVSEIWPLTATLTTLNGENVPDTPPVPFAVWEGSSDRFSSRGRYDDTEGEVPAEFADAVKGKNLALLVGTRKYRIQSAHTHFAQPHVSLKLVSLDA